MAKVKVKTNKDKGPLQACQVWVAEQLAKAKTNTDWWLQLWKLKAELMRTEDGYKQRKE